MFCDCEHCQIFLVIITYPSDLESGVAVQMMYVHIWTGANGRAGGMTSIVGSILTAVNNCALIGHLGSQWQVYVKFSCFCKFVVGHCIQGPSNQAL